MYCPFCGRHLPSKPPIVCSCGKDIKFLCDVDKPGTSGEKRPASCVPLKKKQLPSKDNMQIVEISVGLKELICGGLCTVRGARLPLFVRPESDAGELQRAAEQRLRALYKHLYDRSCVLVYPDGTKITNIPGTQVPFTLKEYKKTLRKAYQRITVYICTAEDFLSSRQKTSESSLLDSELSDLEGSTMSLSCAEFSEAYPLKCEPVDGQPGTDSAALVLCSDSQEGGAIGIVAENACDSKRTQLCAPVITDEDDSDSECSHDIAEYTWKGGIFYQALPDVGPDGKNIMKLIPVQRINGQYFRTPTGKPSGHSKPTPLTGALGTCESLDLTFSPTGQKVRNQEPAMNCLPKQLAQSVTEKLMDHDYSLNKKPPVIATSLASAREKHLQTPVTTQVKTVQASEPPTGIKKPISSVNPDTNIPSVKNVAHTPATPLQSINALSSSAHKELYMSAIIPTSTLVPMTHPKPQEVFLLKCASGTRAPVDARKIAASIPLPTVKIVENQVTAMKSKKPGVVKKPGVIKQLLDHDYSLINKPLVSPAPAPAPAPPPQIPPTKQITQTSQQSSSPSPPITLYMLPTGVLHGIHSPSVSADKPLLKTSSIAASTSEPMVHPKPQNSMSTKGVSDTCESVHLSKAVVLNSLPMVQTVKNIVSVANTPAKKLSSEQLLDHDYSFKKQVPVAGSTLPPRSKCPLTPPTREVPISQASKFPTEIEKPISIARSFADSGSPCVKSVSPPAEAAQQCINKQTISPPEQLSKISDICIPTLGRSKPSLRLISRVPRRPNSPMKWVIEEDEVMRVSPLNSCVTSAILQTVAEREQGSNSCETLISPRNLATCKEEANSSIVCNGKVFFPVKKHNLERPTVATKKKEDEVIDLCNDDDLDGSPQQATSTTLSKVTNPDEDNVIFVSYVPPKPESAKTQNLTQKAHGKDTEQNSTEANQRSLDVKRTSTRENLGGHAAPLCPHKARDGSTRLTAGGSPDDCDADGSSKVDRRQSKPTQHPGSSKLHVDTQSPTNVRTSGSSKETFPRGERRLLERSSPPKPRHISDHLLRQAFGITSDVKICLHRINEAWIGPVEDIQETWSVSKKDDCFIHHFGNSQKTDNNARKSDKTKAPSELHSSEDLSTSHLQSKTRPLKCSPLKRDVLTFLKSQCSSSQSSHRAALCEFETEPMFEYVEPLDEDLSSEDESNTPSSRDTAARPQTQNCVDPSGNARRMGRARKRTTCPCCIPGSPAVKTIARVEEAETWAWKTERRIKKGRRMLTKAQRKEVKSSGGLNCVAKKNKQSWQSIEIPAVTVYAQRPGTVN